MKKLQDLIQVTSGSPQFRINLSTNGDAPTYMFYGQSEIENDLVNMEVNKEDAKAIRTTDEVNTLEEGDVLFSLVSGRATLVRAVHKGYLYTQNYVKLVPINKVDKRYIVYLLNENTLVRKQLQMNLQGSTVLKYTIKQLKELEMPQLPSIEKQRIVGNIYFDQLRLQALKERVVDAEKVINLYRLREVK